MIIGFVGLSHLGLVSLCAATNKGCDVIAYDLHIDAKLINAHSIGINEPGLNSIFKKNKKRIKITKNIQDLSKCDLIYISKDVPTNSNGKSDLKPIKKIVKRLSFLYKKPILIILSQVNPGFTRKIKWNKKKLFYQVETLVFGNALKRALKPERIIIGSNNSNEKIDPKLKSFLNKFKCPILNMNYESAELAKISINMFLVSSITTTNLLSELSTRIGAHWTDISKALKLDRRIGGHAYLNPGLGISGGNLERDVNSVIQMNKKMNLDSRMFEYWKKKSQYYKNWPIRKFLELKKKIRINNISILGLTYKPDTDSLKNSPSLEIISKLKREYSLTLYDPVIKSLTSKNYNFSNSIIEAVKDSDLIFIMTPWKQFKILNSKKITKMLSRKIIIDPFEVIVDKLLIKNNKKYFSINKRI
ncbi:nucleotide sugar dehydrogenase [Candidatus Pelagibacter sp.]|jgi:UDPglucose 6-dehydrogenase|nr:nucleotide sugar dehydrogenase [Candidatus Pelagibacter sp.]|tara:strand:+ start:2333 stop:3583 length:1251 start_codon:yes stop_codon:yes gene_type:complete